MRLILLPESGRFAFSYNLASTFIWVIKMGNFTIQQFEADGYDENGRFWYAHIFMHSLGYDAWPAFQKVLTKAMGACAKLDIDPTESFIPTTYLENGKECKTYKLSRFACFLVSMYADPNKPEVALARAALAAIAGKLVEEKIRESDLGRLETRDDLKTAERSLSGVARGAGLESTQFGFFKDAGFRGMYNMSLKALQIRKGVDSKQVLYDFMNLEELAGNLFRVTQTTARINSTGVRGLPALQTTAYQVGREVRNIMSKNGGTPPESLVIEENISGVKKRMKNAHKEMKKMDGKPKPAIKAKAKAISAKTFKVQPEQIHDELLDYLINRGTPGALLDLSSHTLVDGVSDIEFDEVSKNGAGYEIKGTASVDVTLGYGSGEDHSQSSDSYPIDFNLTLDEDLSIEIAEIEVDTSGFYGDDV